MARDRITPAAARLERKLARARSERERLAAFAEWRAACRPLNAPPRVKAHPRHAVVDGVTYPNGLPGQRHT
jgi:hypothetical protein